MSAQNDKPNDAGADPSDGQTLETILLQVQRASDLLRDPTPAHVERCAVALGSAVSEMTEWLGSFHALDPYSNRRLLDEARRLRAAVRRAGRLLESVAAFHAGWRQTFSSLCSGYTPSGVPAEAAPAGRLCLRG